MHIGKIGQKSAAFINHKPFHPGSYKNLEKVWIAEQKDAELKRKQQELLEQRLQEGKIEELRHALHTGQAAALSNYRTGSTDLQWVGGDENDGQLSTVPSHIAREISDNKLDWMYQNASQIRADQDREKFLLGEKIVEDVEEDEKQALRDLKEKTAGSLLLGAKSALSEVELMKRVREDPMFAVKQAELAHQQALQKNPLIRARLRAKAEEESLRLAEEAKVKEAEAEEPKKKHHRHHHHKHRHRSHHRKRHHSSDSEHSRLSRDCKRSRKCRSPDSSLSARRQHSLTPTSRSRSRSVGSQHRQVRPHRGSPLDSRVAEQSRGTRAPARGLDDHVRDGSASERDARARDRYKRQRRGSSSRSQSPRSTNARDVRRQHSHRPENDYPRRDRSPSEYDSKFSARDSSMHKRDSSYSARWREERQSREVPGRRRGERLSSEASSVSPPRDRARPPLDRIRAPYRRDESSSPRRRVLTSHRMADERRSPSRERRYPYRSVNHARRDSTSSGQSHRSRSCSEGRRYPRGYEVRNSAGQRRMGLWRHDESDRRDDSPHRGRDKRRSPHGIERRGSRRSGSSSSLRSSSRRVERAGSPRSRDRSRSMTRRREPRAAFGRGGADTRGDRREETLRRDRRQSSEHSSSDNRARGRRSPPSAERESKTRGISDKRDASTTKDLEADAKVGAAVEGEGDGAHRSKVRHGPQVEESLLGRLRTEGEAAILGPPTEMIESLRRRQQQLRAAKTLEAAEAERLDLESMKAEAEKKNEERQARLAEIKKHEMLIEARDKALAAGRLPEEAPKFIAETRKDLLNTIDRVAQLHNMRRRDNLDEGY